MVAAENLDANDECCANPSGNDRTARGRFTPLLAIAPEAISRGASPGQCTSRSYGH
jgi:hypothetical protein